MEGEWIKVEETINLTELKDKKELLFSIYKQEYLGNIYI
jgi:hypothetical protein